MEKKLQWSKTFGGEMFVIREDDEVEFDRLVAKYKAQGKIETDFPDKPVITDTQECPIHHVTMTGKEGKYGKFYSHKTDTGWCNGKIKERTY